MRTSLKLFLSIFFFLFGSIPAQALEAPRYDINVSIDTSAKKIQATQSVTFTNNTKTSTDILYFHIYPNRLYTEQEQDFISRYAGFFKVDAFPGGFKPWSMTIEEVARENQAIGFAIEGDDKTLLKIPLAESIAPGQSVTVSIRFSVEIPHAYGRFGWHESVIALARWYPILCVYNEAGWNKYPFYPYQRPFFSDAAHYKVMLTVPQEYNVIHTGEVVTKLKADGSSTKALDLQTTLPVRDFSLALSPDYKVSEESFEGMTLKAFYLPGGERDAAKTLAIVKSMMGYYTKLFGPYPYKTFSVAPVYLGYGGEQLSQMIFIDARAFELPEVLHRYFDFLVAHETGHQWFYNIVGFDDYTQMWLEEGVHSYFLSEYLADKYGRDAGVLDLPQWTETFIPRLKFRRTRDLNYKILTRIGLEHPIIDKLSSFSEPSSIFSLTYGKGARVTEMLRHTMGDEAFASAFRRVFNEYRHKNLDIKDFMRICQEESKQDLTWFFDQWLFTTKSLDAAVVKVKGQEVFLKNRRQAQMPTDVTVDFKDGTQKSFKWSGDKKEETVNVGGPSPIKRVTLDSEEKLLDIDRTNNHWPRQLRIVPVPVYHPLYDMPVFLPEDSYNLVVGPEFNEGIGVKTSLIKPYDQQVYAGTTYDINEHLHHARVGYQLNNILGVQTSLNAEIKNTVDHDDHEDDLTSGRLTLRRELSPIAYGLTQVNDHASLYVARNRSVKQPYTQNTSYLRRDEAIVGAGFHLGRGRPYWDPREGFTFDTFAENSGHFMGATQSFNRVAVDMSLYQKVTFNSKLAGRLKLGIGKPNERNLFELGGINGLRGFDRKTVRGANMVLGSLEYRFPLMNNLNVQFFDNILALDSVSGAAFVDAGQSWYDHFDDSRLRKDAGLGLRFHFNVTSYLEKVVVRLDAAQAINEDDDDVHYWLGVNQPF